MSLLAALALAAHGQAPPITPNALPYTLTFEEIAPTSKPLPGCHSYAAAMIAPNRMLVLGGRSLLAGLHTFETNANNFPSPNRTMMVIDPTQGTWTGFDVTTLPWHLARVMMSANAGGYYDPSDGYFYLLGGYGPGTADMARANYATFGTILRFKAASVVQTILLTNKTDAQKAAIIAPMIQWFDDERLAVTGANLFRAKGNFYLMFGQTASGMYEAFGGGNFQQSYNCQVVAFKTDSLFTKLLTYGAIATNPDFHRRDGNSVLSVDPTTESSIIAAFGGVFPPGIIGAYPRPVYVAPTLSGGNVVEASVSARFGSYECPMVVAYSANDRATYHNFFGGIGHYFFHQTYAHAGVYTTVTKEGRNDGLPFIEDVTAFVRKRDGSSQEWILTKPIAAAYPPPAGGPPSNLRGTGALFFPNPAPGGPIDGNGIVLLDRLPANSKSLVGYIYGGIEAQNPLPVKPNSGTTASNALYRVWITNVSSGAIDAKYARPAGAFQTPATKEKTSGKPPIKR